VVVAVANRDVAAYPSALTIGGVSATRDAGKLGTGAASVWSAVVPTGTTATIVVTYTDTQSYCGIGVWTLTSGTFVASATSAGGASATMAATVTTQAGDFVICACAYRGTVTGGNLVTWNAATERYDAAVDGSVRQHAGADMVAVGTSTDMGATIPVNYGNESVLAAAAYR